MNPERDELSQLIQAARGVTLPLPPYASDVANVTIDAIERLLSGMLTRIEKLEAGHADRHRTH